MASLRPQEAAQVLAWLVDKHPELAAEAEKLAAAAIAPQPRDQIEASVSKTSGRVSARPILLGSTGRFGIAPGIPVRPPHGPFGHEGRCCRHLDTQP
jgi:hypothetical protein